jgi:hypothetical protein
MVQIIAISGDAEAANALFFVGWRLPRHRCAGEFLWFRVLPFAIISESLIG